MTTLSIRVMFAAAAVLLGTATGSPAQPASPPATAAPAQPPSHAVHGGGQEKPKAPATGQEDHSAHQEPAGQQEYPAGVPPITGEDRAAAFPKLDGQHSVHDDGVHYYVLFDQLEWQEGDGVSGANWDTNGWIGKDVDRLWFRTEGDSQDGELGEAQAHLLYGRAIRPWWDIVAGVRQDFGPGPARTWAAVGMQGLAPYWLEVQVTAYVGQAGRTHVRFETEYELLLTNRLILQPQVELEIHGKSDPERRIGAGLSSLDTGLRLRYEFRRELAPYVGVTWNLKFFGTADLARTAGEDPSTAKLVTGVRLWF
jgi:copper resistance protein B